MEPTDRISAIRQFMAELFSGWFVSPDSRSWVERTTSNFDDRRRLVFKPHRLKGQILHFFDSLWEKSSRQSPTHPAHVLYLFLSHQTVVAKKTHTHKHTHILSHIQIYVQIQIIYTYIRIPRWIKPKRLIDVWGRKSKPNFGLNVPA